MKVGILGGGQLSKMLALAGIPMGFDFVFYFPESEHSLHKLGEIIYGSYDNHCLLNEFAQQVDFITYENENIPVSTIKYLQEMKPIFPDANALTVSRDRLKEKKFFLDLNIPTNKFMEVNNLNDAINAGEKLSYPFFLKKRKFGYDGKGQFLIKSINELKKMTQDIFSDTIAEEHVNFDREVSLIMAKNSHGFVHYDLCENTHSKGILRKTINIKKDPITKLAIDHTKKVAEELNYNGILTIEFFQVGDILLVNEMAPRVHNSGHWSIDACITSQFENHLRAISNLPLGKTTSLAEVAMFNILSTMPNKSDLYKIDGLCLHDYKKRAAEGRKLGHITVFLDEWNQISSDFESMFLN